jgi:hypothetical protein
LFFDPASSTQSVATASWLGQVTATQDHSSGACNNSVINEMGTLDFSCTDNQPLLPAGSASVAPFADVRARRR